MATLQEALSLAIGHHQAGRLGDAKAIYDQILAQLPDHAETNRLLGVLAAQVDRFGTALRYLTRAVLLAPEDAAAWLNLGGAQRALRRPADAERSLARAVRLAPDNADAWNNLGSVHHFRGDFGAAVHALRHAVALAPDHAAALTSLGAAQRDGGDHAASAATLRRAVAVAPGQAEPQFALSVTLLADGCLAEGWAWFEARRRRPGTVLADPDRPRWRGEPLAGRSLLLHSEQGRGDTIQFARLAPLLARQGARVVLSCQPDLVALMATLDGVSAVAEPADLAGIDLQCPLMSVPAVLGWGPDRETAAAPYLRADPERAAAWRARLDGSGALKVGLIWAGNPGYALDHLRSPGLAALQPLFALPGIAWHLLQVGEGRRQLAGAHLPPATRDLGGELRDFADTAAVMAGMDVVISSDTGTAHLAGALGCDTRVLVSALPDFRWAEASPGRSLWYGSARLYRQRRVLDWAEPVARLADDLRRLAS